MITNTPLEREELPEFSGIYQGRILPELVYLAQTLGALHDVHKAMHQAVGMTEPKLQATEQEFIRLLEHNLCFINREIAASLNTKEKDAS